MSYNKFSNVTCKCLSGHIHDSRGEAKYCSELFYQKQSGEIRDYEIQKRFSMDINGKHICNHYVDFYVEGNDGKFYVVEYKGFYTDVWALKKKMFEAIYTDIPYNVIKHDSFKKWRGKKWTRK